MLQISISIGLGSDLLVLGAEERSIWVFGKQFIEALGAEGVPALRQQPRNQVSLVGVLALADGASQLFKMHYPFNIIILLL